MMSRRSNTLLPGFKSLSCKGGRGMAEEWALVHKELLCIERCISWKAVVAEYPRQHMLAAAHDPRFLTLSSVFLPVHLL